MNNHLIRAIQHHVFVNHYKLETKNGVYVDYPGLDPSRDQYLFFYKNNNDLNGVNQRNIYYIAGILKNEKDIWGDKFKKKVLSVKDIKFIDMEIF